MALDPARDWMVPASREQPAMLRHGWPLQNMLAAYMGRLEAAVIPAGVRMLPRQQSIGAQMPQAAGLAWALRIKGERGAVLAYCGDGASSEGDFHEACNLAGVMRAPLVVVLINNSYAISTPVAKQTAGALAARAPGYGFPGISVDGNDVFAVYAASKWAVERALAAEGPALIECETYRMSFHNTTDNPNEYRSAEEVEAAARFDPIDRLRRYAVRAGIASEETVKAMEADAQAQLRASYEVVSGLPRPGAPAIFEHIYDELPARVSKQRADILGGLGPDGS